MSIVFAIHILHALPQESKSEHYDDGQQPNAPVLRLDEDFDQAVKKGSKPEEPLEESCGQHEAHDSDIDDLVVVSNRTDILDVRSQLTSDGGHDAAILASQG